MNPGDILPLLVERLAFGGDAIAHAPDGRTVFLDGGAPGDRVEARLDEVRPRFARARLLRVLEPGPHRVAAPCPLVEACGGCPWQSVSLDEQRSAKRSIVERALRKAVPAVEVAPLVAPTAGFGYRTRARLTKGSDGALGFQARRSHAVVDVPACPLLHPALACALAEARPVVAPLLRPGGTLSLLAGRGGAVHLAVHGLCDLDEATRTHLRVLVGRAGIAGIGGEVGEGEPAIDTGDDDDGREPTGLAHLAHMAHMAAADGFAQATHEGNRALRALVRDALSGPHARALELYCGDGNFTRDLARAASEVVAVEGDRAACARLRRNLPDPARVTILVEPAERAALRLARDGARFDVALLDPPRAGAPRLAPALAALAPRVVYVSCDPMTLARDAAALVALGFTTVRATPVDLMPHTFHVETVCLFEKRPPSTAA